MDFDSLNNRRLRSEREVINELGRITGRSSFSMRFITQFHNQINVRDQQYKYCINIYSRLRDDSVYVDIRRSVNRDSS